MPKHYKKKRGANQKTRFLRGPGVSTISNMPSFPVNKISKFKYSNTASFNPTVDDDSKVGTDNKYICANSIYFPDVTTGDSHHPLGYDEWAKFYERWVVLSSKIQIDWLASQNQAGINNIIGVHLTDEVADRDAGRLVEQGACKYRTIQVIANGNAPSRMTAFYNAKSWHTIADVADADDLQAVFDIHQYDESEDPDADRRFNCKPQNLTYYNLFSQGDGVAVDGGLVECRYTIEYTVLFKDPRELPRSFDIRPDLLYSSAAGNDPDGGTGSDPDEGEDDEEKKG